MKKEGSGWEKGEGECKPPDRSPAPAQLERRTHGARSCRRSRGETGLSEIKRKKTTIQQDKKTNKKTPMEPRGENIISIQGRL